MLSHETKLKPNQGKYLRSRKCQNFTDGSIRFFCGLVFAEEDNYGCPVAHGTPGHAALSCVATLLSVEPYNHCCRCRCHHRRFLCSHPFPVTYQPSSALISGPVAVVRVLQVYLGSTTWGRWSTTVCVSAARRTPIRGASRVPCSSQL